MENIYWAWLQSVPKVGTARFEQLMAHCGSPREIYEIAKSDANKFEFLGELTKNNIAKHAREYPIDRIAQILDKHSIKLTTIFEPDYPELLKHVYMPPPVLYIKGSNTCLHFKKAISIVGTRKQTLNGKATAIAFAKMLATQGVTVVSGLAMGIDTAAHEGALMSQAPLPTIAVLASGVEKASPVCNDYLYRQIVERGCVVSESFPGTPAMPGSFPIRNRIIAGLSHGTLVVEAGIKSGTFHTVNYALDAGRDVFVIPGRLNDEQSLGALDLIKDGAIMVTNPYEIMNEYRWQFESAKPAQTNVKTELSSEESQIYLSLKSGEMTSDELYELTSIPMPRLLSLLTKLCHKGIISRTSYMSYYI